MCLFIHDLGAEEPFDVSTSVYLLPRDGAAAAGYRFCAWLCFDPLFKLLHVNDRSSRFLAQDGTRLQWSLERCEAHQVQLTDHIKSTHTDHTHAP